MLSERDIKQLNEKGITEEKAQWQLEVFQNGLPYVNLNRPAVTGDGVIQLSEDKIGQYSEYFDSLPRISKIKFVPASGAATRMFKTLFEYLESSQKGEKDPEADASVRHIMAHLDQFAFFNDLKKKINERGYSLQKLIEENKYDIIIDTLLTKRGLGYGDLPKGLLKFHKSKDLSVTAFYEHLVEAVYYAVTDRKQAHLHFTISDEHRDIFMKHAEQCQVSIEKRFDISLHVSFSIQKPSTDTMAVDKNNNPLRSDDGSIIFRPAGHGALIENLNSIDAQLIFIKNIDNVSPEKSLKRTILYKKALAGLLFHVQKKIFGSIREINETNITIKRSAEILDFITSELFYEPSRAPDFSNADETKQFLLKILDRPLRVCGVVKNQGEPGGGPFWAPNSRGDNNLQIVESSQVDHGNPVQETIFQKATHFNPVDLVCSPYRYDGSKFDLTKFVDSGTCFIASKSKDGKEIKALELPGLWNGAMADWITLFVEVPGSTFNPVKTVNDLLRPQHL